jgi:TldD protein
LKRKDFLRLSALGAGGMLAPSAFLSAKNIDPLQSLQEMMDVSIKKSLANTALNAATAKGASYADVRIGRYLNQFVATRENKVQRITNTESFGAGVRVLVNGCWGFASSDNITKENISKIAERAVAVAKANSKIQGEHVQLAPQKGYGDVSWKTPIIKNAFEIPLKEKIDLLLSANAAALNNGASFVDSTINAVNEQKYFASTDGSYIDQDIHRIFPLFHVTKIDRASGKFDTRNSLSAPKGMGYEYLSPDPNEKITGVVSRYKKRYDILEDIKAAALNAGEKSKAKSVTPGKYDLVLDPSHLWLTIHESVGHPTELDRVLGYEANFAGTSFLTLDKWESKNFQFGNNKVNIVADKTQAGSLGAAGYDDEGVKCKQWELIKDGILVNYQATRDQAHIVGEKESNGCSFAQSWADVQFQRMPNVSLQPSSDKRSADDIIKNTENGIYIIGDGSYSIDQQRYNFQFGGQLFYEIKNGQITGMLRDVAYQANTKQFWNSMTDLADKDDYCLGGAFNDGKGEPSQISAVSHGCSTARFNEVTVINTAR